MRINEAVEDGSLAKNEVILAALHAAPRVHLIGLVSEGGVHSSHRHLKALIELAAQEGVEDLVIHAFTDGRDTAPKSGAKMLATVAEWCEAAGVGRIGSVIGRYLAMDRDTRWDRTEKAVEPAAARRGGARGRDRRGGRARRPTSATRRTSSSTRRRSATRTPRSATATPCSRSTSAPTACARSREALDKDGVERYACLTEYEEGWPYPVAFPPDRPDVTLAKVIAERGESAAARGGDREVPARDVLLQRRRGGAVRGRGARARRLAARRADVRREARDERAGGGRRVHPPLEGRALRRSGSSTSPTRTWSATRA